MSIGIEAIGVYIPEGHISNLERNDRFGVDESFIKEKLGIFQTARKSPDEQASDLAVHAVKNLFKKVDIQNNAVECLILVTQNPDFGLPHTSAIVHSKLGLSDKCAAFDISLGCSGYVYGLSVIESFMRENKFENGILITSDPYSLVVDENDRNTAMLFGDAATATLMSMNSHFKSGKYTFGTLGDHYEDLIVHKGKLKMNGRSIFDFAARRVPADITHLLDINEVLMKDIDKFIFHQASKYMVDTISHRLGIDKEKAKFEAGYYGNTVSSSIPIVLESVVQEPAIKTIVISGFGVGLSWASGMLHRV